MILARSPAEPRPSPRLPGRLSWWPVNELPRLWNFGLYLFAPKFVYFGSLLSGSLSFDFPNIVSRELVYAKFILSSCRDCAGQRKLPRPRGRRPLPQILRIITDHRQSDVSLHPAGLHRCQRGTPSLVLSDLDQQFSYEPIPREAWRLIALQMVPN
jgi:hypothetical protein